MTEPASIDAAKSLVLTKIGALRDALERCATAAANDDVDLHIRGLLSRRSALSKLAESASRNLMTVAMLGPFSSGKTLLLSALLDQLDATMDEDGTSSPAPRLLPSDTRPTTSRPLLIRQGDSARFMIRSIGDTNFQIVDPTPRTLLRYLTDLSHSGASYSAEVAEAVLELPDLDLACAFLDLPGTQSDRAEDDAVIQAGMDDADCFVFAVPAGRTLDRDGRQQLTDLFQEFSASSKPVFFALTQIDNAMGRVPYEGNARAWEVSRDQNNRLLHEWYGHLDRGIDFVGDGFIPIASPSRAKAQFLDKTGLVDPKVAAELREGDPHNLKRFFPFSFPQAWRRPG